MDFTDYQEAARKTAIYPEGSLYSVLGLAEEAGEVAGKFAKAVRDQTDTDTLEFYNAIVKELGDVLWMLSAVCTDNGIPLSEVARVNIEKLKSRAQRGKLGGSGDDR